MNEKRVDPSRELTGMVVAAYYRVFRKLRAHPTYPCSHFAQALAEEIGSANLEVDTRRPTGSPLDFVVGNLVVVQVEKVPHLNGAHLSLLCNGLKRSQGTVGLLFNFGSARPQFRRVQKENL